MKILIFCPTGPRLEREVVNALFNQKKVEWFDILFTRENPGMYKRNIQLNAEKMRHIVLSQGYDKVWWVESDTIPPRDALSKLLEVDAPIVGGLYALRHGEPIPNVYRWASTLHGIGGGMSWEDVTSHWGETIQVSGACTGCLLIDRTAIENFCFEYGGPAAPDGPFMEYCLLNGFKQMARLDVVCGHKRPDGSIIWPDEEKGYRIEVN